MSFHLDFLKEHHHKELAIKINLRLQTRRRLRELRKNMNLLGKLVQSRKACMKYVLGKRRATEHETSILVKSVRSLKVLSLCPTASMSCTNSGIFSWTHLPIFICYSKAYTLKFKVICCLRLSSSLSAKDHT